jgi:crotonobetainyl-CoA:carnitine CoA-transferase CaiB-like acyl-CoA transferase
MGALSHLRVVEIGSAAAASYCARMFADFGAQVTKIEPTTGDPLRHAGPLTPGGNSAWFAFLNAGKSSLVADRAALDELLLGCDVLIDGRALDPAGCPDFDVATLRARNPGLVHIEMSWFGGEGPYEGFAMSDVVCRALVGLSKLTGPSEGPPLAQPDFQTGIFAGLWGYIAATSALISREIGGDGARLTVSIYEACIAIGEYLMFESFSKGDVMQRIGVNRFWPTFPVGIYATADGWLGVTTVTPAQWMAFCDMLGLTEMRNDERFAMGVDRLQHVEEIEARFIPKLKERNADHWFAEGLKRRIPIVPVPSMADLIASEERRTRNAVRPVSIGTENGMMPGSMLRLRETPPQAGGRVPDVGEAQNVKNAIRASATPQPASPRKTQLPLEGVRIVDFSMGWAGPLCTRTLADLGADVIKIESIQYADWWRGVDRRPAYILAKEYEKVPRFSMINRNKRGITLDLSRSKGVALAKQLVATADVVVDNYSVEVLPKLGLGYDVLRKLNPALVVMSMSAFGQESKFRDCRAYGSTLEQGSGLPSVIGAPDGPPTMQHTAFGDPVGGLNGASAVLTALLHARRTGQGQFIDLSQIECMMPFAAPWMIAHSIGGKPPVRYGNRHPDHVPHGCFPCTGENSWIAIAVTSDAMWHAFCDVLGKPEWASDTTLERRTKEDAIEAAIADWTRTRRADDAMAILQQVGVAAGVLRSPIEMLQDPQLTARGFVQYVERDFIGRHPEPSMPIRAGSDAMPIRFAAPTLGQANAEVLKGILGLSDAEFDELARAGIIGTEVPLIEETAAKQAATG